jgi:hypothetical protein
MSLLADKRGAAIAHWPTGGHGFGAKASKAHQARPSDGHQFGRAQREAGILGLYSRWFVKPATRPPSGNLFMPLAYLSN